MNANATLKPIYSAWEWQEQGACAGLPSEIFFHPEFERGSAKAQREAKAKAICATCPVLAQCRAQALAAEEPYGVWGGLSEEDRLHLLNRQTLGTHSKTLRIRLTTDSDEYLEAAAAEHSSLQRVS
jgi:WhiB family redox-sensing transcriptional regulator